MKKYYLMSFRRSLVYLIMAISLIGLSVICFFADEIHSGVVFVVTTFLISAAIILAWFIYSLTMRIQIDYEKKELYTRHHFFIKRWKFEDILSIEIIDLNKVVFSVIVTTSRSSTRMAYARYLHYRPSEEITAILNELKQDFMNISNKNY